ncbi:hypothetical protein GTQ34_02540 [Muricauda sp. JGD-17]|uniref:L-2-amino-thiazoline-4-carboxylic acid hydrolase n=1 Tax=Flagellimonas ochracea TaxID=2696472 RepID=A0A964T9L3_9FLAO|nr:L-2-amino-thiazoline-4-carboxylic acid hydrolase [Allomuricauda ochracea]NAY90785.1 hypothetical protein [Allomuricauda ochracea]
MVTKKQIRKSILLAEKVLIEHLDNQQIREISSTMEISYREMESQLPLLKSSFNRMLLKISIDSLAFYRALLMQLRKEDALKLIQPFVNMWMDAQFNSWTVRKVYGSRFLHRLYRRYWFARTNKVNDLEGQRFEYVRPYGDLFYGVNVTRCGHVNFLKKMNAPELAPFMCQADFYIQKFLPKGIKFERSQVIAEGASYCDFRYIME